MAAKTARAVAPNDQVEMPAPLSDGAGEDAHTKKKTEKQLQFDNSSAPDPGHASLQFEFSSLAEAETTELPQRHSLPWPEFAHKFSQPQVRTEKGGAAWLPAIYHAGKRRSKKTVAALTAWGLDLDKGNLSAASIKKKLNGFTFLAHTTFSSKPDAKRWRVIIPLAQQVPPTKSKALFDHFQTLFDGVLDEACKDPSRLYYGASCPSGAKKHFQFILGEGEFFDASELADTAVELGPNVEIASAIPQRVLDESLHHTRLRQHLEADPKVLKFKEDGSIDRSKLDWSLICVLGRAGFFDDEIAATLRGYGHGKAGKKGDSYIVDAIAKMRAELGPRIFTDKPKIHIITAAELQHMELPEVRWVIPKMLPEGLAILAGRPKQGKSRIAMNIGLALAHGGYVLGKQKVDAAGVLMLSLEDSNRRLQHRMTELQAEGRWPESLHFTTDWPRGNVTELETFLDRFPDVWLVIIDTWGRWKPMPAKGKQAYDYDADVDNCSALKRLADARGIAILLVHHTRKAGSSHVIDEISGTAGIAGTVDTIWVMKKEQGEKAGELYITGRDVEEETYAIEWDHVLFCWKLVGLAAKVNASDERKEILDYLQQHPQGKEFKEIVTALAKPGPAIGNLLSGLETKGLVEKHEGRWRITPCDF